MKFPFYRNEDKTYTIDDANYECGRVIVADCPNSHRYASLCELIEDCPGIKQLTRPCIVDALNDLQTLGQQSGLSPEKRFLRIWTDGCLEVANPCICNDWDKYVIATEDDNDPGPLSTKVRWSCSDDGLYCIDIEVGWPKTLVWRPSGPNGPFINPDLPNCPDAQEAYVKLKKQGWDWVVDYKCEEIDQSPEHLYAFHNWWYGAKNSYRKALRYFAPSLRADTPSITDPTASEIGWGWTILWTDAFWPAKWIGVFQILKPWVYAISFSAYIEAGYNTSNIINAIRCWLYSCPASVPRPNAGNFIELWDFKYEFGEWMHPGGKDWYFNRMHPQKWNSDLFYSTVDSDGYVHDWLATDMSWFPFTRTYILNINVPQEIAFRVWVDMRYVDVRWTRTIPDDFNIHISSAQEAHEDANSAACRIDCTRIWDSIVQGRMHSI